MHINSIFKKSVTAMLLAFTLFFGSCSHKKGINENTIKITATFYPIYVLLLNITDGISGIQLSMLAPTDTGCLHDYQLTTGDMKKIEECSILVANGAEMENFLDKLLELKSDKVIIAAEGFPLVEENPHVWVSPRGAQYMAKQITRELSVLDPAHSQQYENNCQIYVSKLDELCSQMHSILDQHAGKKIVTFHEAFPYFADEFNLKIESVIEREPGTAPSPRELAELVNSINSILAGETRIALFAEPQYSSSAAQVIARETGLNIYELDPCVTGNSSVSEARDSYINAMKNNAIVLGQALSDLSQ